MGGCRLLGGGCGAHHHQGQLARRHPFLTAPLFAAPDFTSPVAWSVVFYQAILGSVAHIWWYEAVHAVGPSRSAVFMNLQPVVGVLLAWAMLGERITASGLLGGAAVLLGVALTSRRAPAGKASSPPAGAPRG